MAVTQERLTDLQKELLKKIDQGKLVGVLAEMDAGRAKPEDVERALDEREARLSYRFWRLFDVFRR